MRLATLPLVVLLALVSWASGQITDGQWTYVIEDGGATITESTAAGDVTIPSELGGYVVKKVGRNFVPVFLSGSQVTSVNIPASVTSFWDAFGGLTGLTSISIGSASATYSSIDGALFNKTATTLLLYPFGKQGSYTIPTNVTSIGELAFANCTGLTSVNIPNSVTSIEDYAFFECTGLISVNIPNSVTSMGDGAFFGCTGLTSVNIPNSVTRIRVSAFAGCTGLTSVNIGASATSIEDYAFAGCTGLTSVVIPFYITPSPLAFPVSVAFTRDYTSLVGRNDFVTSLVDKLANTLATNSTFITNLAEAIKSANGTYGIATQSGVSDTITTATSALATKAEITTAINEGKASGIASVTAAPNTWSLFTTSQIQNMAIGDLVLSREVNGSFVLNYDIEQSEDLVNWTPYQALSLPLAGLPNDKAFIRIRAKQ